MNLPPTIMWDITRNEWDEQALLLLEAHTIYHNSLCGSCGQPAIHALDVANTREFTIDSAVCLGCNVKETHSENNKDMTRIKGEKVFVVNSMK